jgi:hypothetical protein
MSVKFDIFISYRRKGGYNTAKLLYDRLRMDGYSVSFDIDTLEKGDFDKELEARVKGCKDFLVVLSSEIFDRFYNPEYDPKDDWVRLEIACALSENKNIVPLVLDGFDWPKNPLPSDVKAITRKNSIDLNPKHFEDAYSTLKRRFLDSQPHWTVRHKKKMIGVFSLAVLAAAAFLYFAISKEISEIAQQKDSLAREMQIKDSITQIQDSIIRYRDSIKQYQDSIRQVRLERRRQDSIRQDSLIRIALSKPGGSKGVPNAGRSLHWIGSNDAVGIAIFEKLIPAGVQKTKCSDDGVNINATKPACGSSFENITCSYSPKLTFTDCKGKLLGVLDINSKFLAESTDEHGARVELANELRRANFSDVVSEIEGYK